MNTLESELHLFQPPLYRTSNGDWVNDFLGAAATYDSLTWDMAAVASLCSFGYVCGERTLFNEIRRQPWLSRTTAGGAAELMSIPPHHRYYRSESQTASTLIELLTKEAEKVCSDRKKIYLLLSGGLDSRIVAGIIIRLFGAQQRKTAVVAVTWGLEDSRDVVYAREAARICGFEWQHVSMDHYDLEQSITNNALHLGAMVSPVHLHCMHWFRNVEASSLVLAGSYGDSVGRAEFSGRHLLQMNLLSPKNKLNLMNPTLWSEAVCRIQNDAEMLHARSADKTVYVLSELEMQGWYMRNMIGHAMSIINRYCKVYQMFTDPTVYSFSWSIHPALRNDQIYAELLEQLNPALARLPWARTNKALSGQTHFADPKLKKSYHNRVYWLSRCLFSKLENDIDPQWFAEAGLFNSAAVQQIKTIVKEDVNCRNPYAFLPFERFSWLASVRALGRHFESLGKNIQPASEQVLSQPNITNYTFCWKKSFYQMPGVKYLGSTLKKQLRKKHRASLMKRSFSIYPVESETSL